MKIASLLPSATEIVYALGLGDDLVGVTHECNWPPQAKTKRNLSHSNLPVGADAAEIDRLVSESMTGGQPTTSLDTDAFRELQPDLVITQDLCAVCAVPAGHVEDALDAIGCAAEIVSLDPSTLTEVLACIHTVGAATGTDDAAASLVTALEGRLARVADAVRGAPTPRVFALEWGDPPFNGGHWVPEMVRIAGGEPVLGSDGGRSVRVSWREITEADPQVLVFMPCGYDLAAAVAEAGTFLDRVGPDVPVYAVHADAYFSRPGPRLVDGVEILASVLHPDRVQVDLGDAVARVR